jgi:hypothetical protein
MIINLRKSLGSKLLDCFAPLAMTHFCTFYETIKFDDIVKSHRNDGFDCRGVLRTPGNGRAQLAPTCKARKN